MEGSSAARKRGQITVTFWPYFIFTMSVFGFGCFCGWVLHG